MIKLSGFGDEISPDLNEQLRVLDSLSIRHLELRGVNNQGVLELSEEEIKGIRKTLGEKDFKVSCIASPIGKIKITDDFNSHLKGFKRAIELAHYFATPYIRVFSYYPPEGGDILEHRDEVMERIKRKTEIAEKEKVVLLHENEADIYGEKPKDCLDILKTVNSANLRCLFDPANFVCAGVRPYQDAYPLLKEYTTYLHIKDAKHSANETLITPAGEGDGEIKEILLALKKSDYKGFLSLEPHFIPCRTV